MKKIKTQPKQEKEPMNKNTKILIYVLTGILALAVIIMILVENSGSYIKINNKTDLKLQSVTTYFQDDEGEVYNEHIFEDLEGGNLIKQDFDKVNFSYNQATLRVSFIFEGQEQNFFVDAGYFIGQFKGKVNIDFSNTEDGNILLKVKASGGILPTPNISCDEEYVFDLIEGELE
ncbi:MAG: hypothetical protein GX321_07515 [Clostridiales bacterium]|nr:hypothetical protein [Clostridiales bacterium]